MLKLLKKFDLHQLLKFGVAVIIFAIPLYPKFPFVDVPGSSVSIRIEDFLLLVTTFLWLLYIAPRVGEVLKDKISQSIMIFLLISLTSVLVAAFVTQTAAVHLALLHWLRRVEYFLPFIIAATTIKSTKDIAFYLKCLVIVLVFSFVFAIGQKYLYWPIITTQDLETSTGIARIYTPGTHLPSTFAGHYDLASFLVLVLPMMFVLFFANIPLNGARTRLISFIAIICGFWLMLNAASRISFVSYLIGASLALFLIRKAKFIPLVLIISVLFASSSMSLVGRYGRIIEVTIEKVLGVDDEKLLYTINVVHAQESAFPQRREKTETPTPTPVPVFEDRSTSIRFNVEWPRAIRAFSKNPLLGTGLSSITLATDNDYLRLLGEVGILGFLAFVMILLRIFTRFMKVFPLSKELSLKQAYVVGVFASFPGVFLNAVFIDIFEASKFAIIFWLLIGLGVGAINSIKEK